MVIQTDINFNIKFITSMTNNVFRRKTVMVDTLPLEGREDVYFMSFIGKDEVSTHYS